MTYIPPEGGVDPGEPVENWIISEHASNYQISVDESGTIFSNWNLGAVGDGMIFTLPSVAPSGTIFTFVCQIFWPLVIDPGFNSILKVVGGFGQGSPGFVVWSDGIGESITLIADKNHNWITMEIWGGWTSQNEKIV